MPVDLLERSTYLATEARKADPDRYLCALFAPPERRNAVLGLVLFHHELARVAEIVSQPMAGLIRYQWWREAVTEAAAGQAPRQHPVVLELAQALARGWVHEAQLIALIDAREPALEQVLARDPETLEAFAAATSGALQQLVYGALGGADALAAEAAGTIGTALGLVGLGRALALEVERPRRADETAERPAPEAVATLLGGIAARSRVLVRAGRRQAGRPARHLMTAFLPATLTLGYLDRLHREPAAAAYLTRPPLAPLALWAHVLLRRP